MKHGKKYRKAAELVGEKMYPLEEAVSLLKKTSTTKFDASCEVHLNLGVDPRQADQLVRGTVALPNGTGKKIRVVAFVPDSMISAVKSAGAVEAGIETLIEKIEKGWLDFDVAVAVPEAMKSLGKIAKTLGQKGLMPNPKAGTVTPNAEKTIEELIRGKVEFRLDKLANLHNIFGKVSFDEAKLLENLKIYLKSIAQAKPASVKGIFVKSITVTTTMGPAIPLDVNAAMGAVGVSAGSV